MATANAVFKWGHRQVKLLTVDDNSPSPPPFPLLVATPLEGTGIFPVILFVHGYLLHNTFYSELFQHIASHGYIVVSPQLYSFAGSDANADCESTGEVIKWLSSSATMSTLLPSGVGGDMTKLTIAGHSRGGKVAFGVAQRGAKISAVIGIDPVDGMSGDKQTEPRILTFKPNSITINAPVMVIGCGLSEQKKNALFPPCAPNGVNHRDFFAECRSPVWYFVAKDYGHLDMLDDDTKGFKGKLTYCLCKNGNRREPMRSFVAGIIVAFLNSQLGGDSGDFEALRNNPETSPVILSEVSFRL